LPTDGPCVIATRGPEPVNVRSDPSTTDPDNIIDQIQASEPGRQAYLTYRLKNVQITAYSFHGAEGQGPGEEIEIESWSWGESSETGEESWFVVDYQGSWGWVSADVTRQGGDCDWLPTVLLSGDNLQQIELAVPPFTWSWIARPLPLPELDHNDDGSLTLECDAALQAVIACDGSAHTVDGLSNTVFFGEKLNPSGAVDAADYVVWRKTDGWVIPSPEDEVLAGLLDGDQMGGADVSYLTDDLLGWTFYLEQRRFRSVSCVWKPPRPLGGWSKADGLSIVSPQAWQAIVTFTFTVSSDSGLPGDDLEPPGLFSTL
jgi:hypothetical protein